jgi:hypothetical protein
MVSAASTETATVMRSRIADRKLMADRWWEPMRDERRGLRDL